MPDSVVCGMGTTTSLIDSQTVHHFQSKYLHFFQEDDAREEDALKIQMRHTIEHRGLGK